MAFSKSLAPSTAGPPLVQPGAFSTKVLICFALVCTALAVLAQAPSAPQDREFPVIFEGKTVFCIRAGIGVLSPEKRAEGVCQRILRMAQDPFFDQNQLVVQETDLGEMIMYRGDLIATVLETDSRAEGRPIMEIARDRRNAILQAVLDYHSAHSNEARLRNIIYSIAATLLLISALFVARKLFKRVERWEAERYHASLERLQLHGGVKLIVWLFKLARWVAALGLIYAYALFLFRTFPSTRGWANALAAYTLIPLKTIFAGFLSSLPNILVIIVILVVARVALKALRTLFTGASEGSVALPGVHRHWAMSTYKIIRLAVIALVMVVIYPYIPGAESPAFKGLTLFTGALVTFGASTTVGNLLNGLILMGVNPFVVGDRVRIGETEGDVTKVTFFTTQIRTIKNVEVTLPNTQVMQSAVTNFSTQSRGPGLIVHTTVTIGYDAPWRKVHENLIEAARRTEHILKDPAPFVLQTALNDFYVSYQLNAFTREANLQASIYGELHQNIQDAFNEAGMEIMSPHFTALRDGNTIAIPESCRPDGYRAGRFGLDAGEPGPSRQK